MNETTSMKRCVIYTRKSTDEGLDKEFNSLEAQFDACAAYIQSQSGNGWKLLERHYDDGGFSGGTTNRPALQQLLEDLANNEFDVVVVYKIDRISRSLADFTELTKTFARYNVSLVSVTQQIDSSTSMGRMIINLLMSFAQFELEMTSDRLADKFAAMRKKGMWGGGVTPIGYKGVDRKLVVDEENAPSVRYAFEVYSECESYLETARKLNEKYGTRPNGKPWNIEHVRKLISCPTVAGKIKDPHTGELFEGQHEAIVSMDLWLKVQQIVAAKAKGKRESRCTASAPLKGVLRCGYCGGAMIPSFSTNQAGKTYNFYRCAKHQKHISEDCQLKSISAGSIEGPIFDVLSRLMMNEYFIQLIADDKKEVEEYKNIGPTLAEMIRNMTTMEKSRLVHAFIRSIDVRRDGFSIVTKREGYRKIIEMKGEKI